jgi:hypothetical protein
MTSALPPPTSPFPVHQLSSRSRPTNKSPSARKPRT